MFQSENEVAEIVGKSANNMTLTLATGLKNTHHGQTVTLKDGSTIEIRAEVGLLSHNVRVRGSSMIEWQKNISACPEGFDTGQLL